MFRDEKTPQKLPISLDIYIEILFLLLFFPSIISIFFPNNSPTIILTHYQIEIRNKIQMKIKNSLPRSKSQLLILSTCVQGRIEGVARADRYSKILKKIH